MTVSARNWAWSLYLTKPDGKRTVFKEKLTLLCLAEMENATDGYAYPSQKYIAEMTGQAERTVRTHLEELERLGLIAKEKRRSDHGRWARNVYVLRVPAEYREKDKEWMGRQEDTW